MLNFEIFDLKICIIFSFKCETHFDYAFQSMESTINGTSNFNENKGGNLIFTCRKKDKKPRKSGEKRLIPFSRVIQKI